MDAQALAPVFAATCSPEAGPRQQAEQYLQQAASQPGYALAVLTLLSTDSAELQVRLAAAVAFKNHVKNRWEPKEADEVGAAPLPAVPDREKEQVKGAVVALMLSSPPLVRAQLSEALSLIADCDFPARWQALLPELIGKLGGGDYAVVNPVLATADAIFGRYRGQYKSETLYKELKYVLELWVRPMLELFKQTGAAVQQGGPPERLRQLLECARLVCSIFYSLNSQELPAEFEDTQAEWMGEFHKYLQYPDAPSLLDADPEKESVVDAVKAAVCENLQLYTEKNDEEFAPFLPTFAQDVWTLLTGVGPEPRKDHLATTAIGFLTTVTSSVHHKIFGDAATLQSICEKIVIPNLFFRDDDVELFEDNWVEYVRRDVEGSDSDTRRRMAMELVKALVAQFKEAVTGVITNYVNTLLGQHAAQPAQNWKQKNCAISLVISLVGRGVTTARGATQINELVPLREFFESQIAPELKQAPTAGSHVLKADCLKFITVFRGQLDKGAVQALMPGVVAHVASPSNVVHSYAAHCVERVLMLKENRAPRFQPADFDHVWQQLLSNLFGALTLPDSGENEYVMKCIMRVVTFAGSSIRPVGAMCLERLTSILTELCQNPKNPSFNHYLFEAVAALIRAADASQIDQFEQMLFPPFQLVLQMDVAEFAPYVFQIFSQLVELRQPPLTAPYMALLGPLLSMELWGRKGNVPALVRLLQAYLTKVPQEVVGAGHLNAVLGVFQTLIRSRANDHHGFYIVNSLVEFLPVQAWEQQLPAVWGEVLQRLQFSKTVKFTNGFVFFFALSMVKHGRERIEAVLSKFQPGLFDMLVKQVWAPSVATTVSGKTEIKLATVAATKLLCEYPALLEPAAAATWGKLLDNCVSLFEKGVVEGGEEEEAEEEAQGFSAAYVALAMASKKESDPCADVPDAAAYLAQSLSRLSHQVPGQLPSRIQQAVGPENQQALAGYLQRAGAALV